jgi:hypothetical protein
MHVADIQVESVADTHGQYSGAVLRITVGALRLRIRLDADAVRALCVGVLGDVPAEVSGAVNCHLALPPALRKRGAELTPETLNAREVEI